MGLPRVGFVVSLGLCCAVLALALSACGGTSSSTSTPTPATSASSGSSAIDALAAEAKTEAANGKKLNWYYILGEEAVRPLIDAFTARYPFVKVEVTGGPGLNLLEKVLTENQSGRPVADVIQGGPLEDAALISANLALDYRPSGEANVPENLRFDKKPFVVPAYFTFHIVYNTDEVSAAQAPKTLEDMTKPEWKGRFGIDAEQVDWFAGELAFYGEAPGMQIMKALAANQPVIYTGTQGYEQMAAGALPSAVNMYSIVLPKYIVDSGAPMAIAKQDHVIAQPDEFIGLKSTDSPATLKLFMEWLFTPEAQAIFPDKMGKTPVLPGIPVSPILAAADSPPTEVFFETSDNFGDFNKRVGEFQKLFVTGQ